MTMGIKPPSEYRRIDGKRWRLLKGPMGRKQAMQRIQMYRRSPYEDNDRFPRRLVRVRRTGPAHLQYAIYFRDNRAR